MIILRGHNAKFFPLRLFVWETVEPSAGSEQTAHCIVDVSHRLHLKKHLKRLMHIRKRRLADTAIQRRTAEYAFDGDAAFFVQHSFNRLFKPLNKRGKIQFFHQ